MIAALLLAVALTTQPLALPSGQDVVYLPVVAATLCNRSSAVTGRVIAMPEIGRAHV